MKNSEHWQAVVKAMDAFKLDQNARDAVVCAFQWGTPAGRAQDAASQQAAKEPSPMARIFRAIDRGA